MSEKILVAVTAAPVARRSVEWATARAASRKASVELVTIVGGAVGAVGEGAIVDAALSDAQTLLDEYAAIVTAAGVPVSTRVESGNPVQRLIAVSADASLLVLGSDYQGPGSGPDRGAHGIRIVAGASCPVVVVPDLDLEGRRGVLVGVDGSVVSEAAVRFAAAEADRLREPLIAVSVWTPVTAPRNATGVFTPQYVESMQTATEEVLAVALGGLRSTYPGLEILHEVHEGYPSAVINRLAVNARLAVLGTHGRGAIARFLLGSISQEVLMRLATATAVVR